MAKALYIYDKQVVFATHDTDMIRRPEYAIDRVLVLDEHAVAFDGAPAEAVAFYEDLIRRKYEAAKRKQIGIGRWGIGIGREVDAKAHAK